MKKLSKAKKQVVVKRECEGGFDAEEFNTSKIGNNKHNEYISVSIRQFPYCCGAYVIGNFQSNDWEDEPTKEACIHFVKRLMEDAPEGKLLTFIMNGDQLQSWEKHLLEEFERQGFECTDEWVNESTKNSCYLYSMVTG